MTEEQIKEHLARGFLQLIANRTGFKCAFKDPDHGVDVVVCGVARRTENGRTRLYDDGRYLDLQLKCTCESTLTPYSGGFKYDLEAKNYNDLVARRGGNAPLLLVLLVIPDDSSQWLTVNPKRVILKRAAYWWAPSTTDQPTTNTRTVRIDIAATQRVGYRFISERMRAGYK